MDNNGQIIKTSYFSSPSQHPDPKKMQVDITGFLNGKNARIFMGELWTHLQSAQANIGGIPAEFLEKKKEEIRQRKVIIVIYYVPHTVPYLRRIVTDLAYSKMFKMSNKDR